MQNLEQRTYPCTSSVQYLLENIADLLSSKICHVTGSQNGGPIHVQITRIILRREGVIDVVPCKNAEAIIFTPGLDPQSPRVFGFVEVFSLGITMYTDYTTPYARGLQEFVADVAHVRSTTLYMREIPDRTKAYVLEMRIGLSLTAGCIGMRT